MYFMRCFNVQKRLLVLSLLLALLTKGGTGHTYCNNPEIVANFTYENLTYIPPVEDRIVCLIFQGNILTNVTKETFVNVSNPGKIRSLHFGYNKIVSIAADALHLFDRLTALDLSGNPFIQSDLKHLLGSIARDHSVRTLRLNEIGRDAVQDDTFSLMDGTKLENLFIKSNNITSISTNFLRTFRFLNQLVLSHNNLADIDFIAMKLHQLELSYNKMIKFPKFCENDTENSTLPRLRTLYFEYNMILELSKESLQCLPNLKILEIRGNFISVLPNDMFLYVPRIYSFNADKNSGHNSRIEPYAFRSKSLGVLKIGSNGPGKTVFVSFTETFKYLPKLIALEISYVNLLDMSEESVHTLFAPLIHLKYFMCYMCQIDYDPKTILEKKHRLNKVKLDRNSIEHLSNDTFKSMPVLRHLYVNMNKIGHLKSSDISVDFLNSLDTLDLSSNPFICDCDLYWFINWLKSAKRTSVSYYPKEYICAYPAKMAGKNLAEVYFTYRECHPFAVWQWACMICGPIVVVIAVVVFIFYRKRWTIKHYIYMVRKRRHYDQIAGENLLYDAFVAYNQDDTKWVQDYMLPHEEEFGLKFCIHERDFQAGVFINDNIVTCIEQSRKIILILSNAFAESGWCMFELKVAHSKHIEEDTELIVILLEQINGRNMNQSMKTLLETTTYIEWTEDHVGQDLFWNKMKDTLVK